MSMHIEWAAVIAVADGPWPAGWIAHHQHPDLPSSTLCGRIIAGTEPTPGPDDHIGVPWPCSDCSDIADAHVRNGRTST